MSQSARSSLCTCLSRKPPISLLYSHLPFALDDSHAFHRLLCFSLANTTISLVSTCSEDTSTSSEDEASTTGTAARSRTTKTADMCRVEVRNGERLLRCTGCGYTSDRRANVTRHYERIHCVLQAEKYRECPCGEC